MRYWNIQIFETCLRLEPYLTKSRHGPSRISISFHDSPGSRASRPVAQFKPGIASSILHLLRPPGFISMTQISCMWKHRVLPCYRTDSPALLSFVQPASLMLITSRWIIPNSIWQSTRSRTQMTVCLYLTWVQRDSTTHGFQRTWKNRQLVHAHQLQKHSGWHLCQTYPRNRHLASQQHRFPSLAFKR